MKTVSYQQQIQKLESHMDRRRLSRLSTDEAMVLLNEVTALSIDLQHADDSQITRELKVLGCRLCSDLTEAILNRALDVLQDKQHSIDFIYEALRQKLQDKYQASVVLHQAQSLKNQLSVVGEQAGVGIVI